MGSAMSSTATANLLRRTSARMPPSSISVAVSGARDFASATPIVFSPRSSRDDAILEYGGKRGLNRLFADHRFVRARQPHRSLAQGQEPAEPAVKREAEEDWNTLWQTFAMTSRRLAVDQSRRRRLHPLLTISGL